MNKNILLVGRSGSGKTVEGQRIVAELSGQGETVLVFDMPSVASREQIFPAFKEQFEAGLSEVDAYEEGISCGLFSPAAFEDGGEERLEDTAGAVLDVLSRAVRFGAKQQSLLRAAVIEVAQSGRYETEGIAALDRVLAEKGTVEAETVREKLYPLTVHNIFRSGRLFVKEGKINVIRLSKFDLKTQEVIAEMLLSYLWRLATTSVFRENGIFIFLDEFQNLYSGKGCVLNQILTEGRKFNINLILATQQLGLNAPSEVQQKLMQCGLVLFFNPNTTQAGTVARLIDPGAADAWNSVLRSLGIGEFVALGSLTVGGMPTGRPLKVSAKMSRKN